MIRGGSGADGDSGVLSGRIQDGAVNGEGWGSGVLLLSTHSHGPC